MKHHSTNPIAIFESLWINRYLIKKSIQREVLGKYRGSIFGVLWSFLTPLLMLCVYTFVFGVIFQARWEGGTGSKSEYALILFSGLICFNIFANCVNQAPNMVTNNSEYVKRLVYPLEIIPVIVLGEALFNAMTSFTVWLLVYFILLGSPPLTIIFLPVVIAPLFFTTLGCSWFLSSLGVYFRDITQFINILTTALLFLSGVFYSVSKLPLNYHIFFKINPLSSILEQVRNVMLFSIVPPFSILFLHYIGSLLICCLGFAWFQKTRKGFADVL